MQLSPPPGEPAYELGVCTTSDVTAGSFSMDYRIELAAPPERVFRALTEEIGRWWPHTWRVQGATIVLEPRLGGRFMEQWDADGRGVLYGHVEVFDPPQRLRLRGAVGMALAVNVMWTISLTETPAGTLLHEATHVSGEVSPRLREGMQRGTEAEYGTHLRGWLERGEALR